MWREQTKSYIIDRSAIYKLIAASIIAASILIPQNAISFIIPTVFLAVVATIIPGLLKRVIVTAFAVGTFAISAQILEFLSLGSSAFVFAESYIPVTAFRIFLLAALSAMVYITIPPRSVVAKAVSLGISGMLLEYVAAIFFAFGAYQNIAESFRQKRDAVRLRLGTSASNWVRLQYIVKVVSRTIMDIEIEANDKADAYFLRRVNLSAIGKSERQSPFLSGIAIAVILLTTTIIIDRVVL